VRVVCGSPQRTSRSISALDAARGGGFRLEPRQRNSLAAIGASAVGAIVNPGEGEAYLAGLRAQHFVHAFERLVIGQIDRLFGVIGIEGPTQIVSDLV
jgi:hypothetical protein